MTLIRFDWRADELKKIYQQPLPDLLYQAQSIHRQFHDPTKMQLCTLLSIKTGGCPEDCAYCPQSAHYDTDVHKQKLLQLGDVIESAEQAKLAGATRFCMGAAWREVKDGHEFNRVLEMVRAVAKTGMEVCCTLGMLTHNQAQALKDAGLTAYNHNLDTGPHYYDRIISTRSYADRIDTLQHVQKVGLSMCSGGILGMGEQLQDRLEMLETLSHFEPHPESVPINLLVPVSGTPLAAQQKIDHFELVRMIATSRIVLAKSRIRLSAGRLDLSDELQTLCFLAGANSIFSGDKLLTTANPGQTRDNLLLEKLGLSTETLAQQTAL